MGRQFSDKVNFLVKGLLDTLFLSTCAFNLLFALIKCTVRMIFRIIVR